MGKRGGDGRDARERKKREEKGGQNRKRRERGEKEPAVPLNFQQVSVSDLATLRKLMIMMIILRS